MCLSSNRLISFLCNRTQNEHFADLKQSAKSIFAAVKEMLAAKFFNSLEIVASTLGDNFSLGTLKNDFAAWIYK
jgi:hypothetical protein